MGTRWVDKIEKQVIESRLKEKISELEAQPEFRWKNGTTNFAVDDDGSPAARVALAACPLDQDLWSGLKNPAMVGMFPIGFREIWEYYANNRKRKTDEAGRKTIFQLARPFESALEEFNRAVVISAMLPVDPAIFHTYNELINRSSFAPWDGYKKAWSELGKLLNQGITRLAFDLARDDRVVVVMNGTTVKRISTEAIPLTHQDGSHGVSKGGNFPQKSVAVLTGLAQFGVSRMVFRDEMDDGKGRRLIGTLSSMILFDKEMPESKPAEEIILLNESWRNKLLKLSDFTNTESSVNRNRFCTYIPEAGEEGCTSCIKACPSGAQGTSAPKPDGGYSQAVMKQQHRFWDGALQFDNSRCCDERGQLANLYDEWMCGRCLSICGGEGNLRPSAVDAFSEFRTT